MYVRFTDEETGGYVSYQCVLPMHVHGSGYVQMQMISNSKAEKLVLKLVLKLRIDRFYTEVNLNNNVFSDSTLRIDQSVELRYRNVFPSHSRLDLHEI